MARNIQTLNAISRKGLALLPDDYTVGSDVQNPDAILLRSHQMHGMEIPHTVRCIGRAGAGTNNIPVQEMSDNGIVVFNTPGANANAVKELVLAGMIMGTRNLFPALKFVSGLVGDDESLNKQVETGKKHFIGNELKGSTLGIVGLGAIGSLIAESAIQLGMNVVGYDPNITVEAAWRLPSQAKKAASIEEVVRRADFVTLHIPLIPETRNIINADVIKLMKRGVVLLNFARGGIVDENAVLDALNENRMRAFVCDFPSNLLRTHPNFVSFPHLGASTEEAEENCAMMVARQVADYLDNGNITNSVNFPNISLPRETGFRLAIANRNMPNMLGQISTTLAKAGLNIHNMLNKSRDDYAFTLVEVGSKVPDDVIAELKAIEGLLRVRNLQN